MPEEEAEINRRTGNIPWRDAKQVWASAEELRQYHAGEDFAGADLALEYDRFHIIGSTRAGRFDWVIFPLLVASV